MPLPKPNLDDRKFDALLAEAMKLLPHRAPDWTDHNWHDPGITLIELFAWLTEMQQYYLNQIPDTNYSKFLKLLGIAPRDAIPARASVTFDFNGPTSVYIPCGTRLSAGDVWFETEKPLTVVPVTHQQKLRQNASSQRDLFPNAWPHKILSGSRAVLKDNTAENEIEGLSFAAFGDNAEAGSSLYLGFECAFPAGMPTTITIDLDSDDTQVTANSGSACDVCDHQPVEVFPSALIVWEYFATDETWQEFIATVHQFATETTDLAEAIDAGQSEPITIEQTVQQFYKRIGDLQTYQRLPTEDRRYIEQRIAQVSQAKDLKEIVITLTEVLADPIFGKWAPLDLAAALEPLIADQLAQPAPLRLSVRQRVCSQFRKSRIFQQLPQVQQELLEQHIVNAQSVNELAELVSHPAQLGAMSDETMMLSRSGRVLFTAPNDMQPRAIEPFRDQLFWIRATIRRSGYELPPRIDSIRLNTTTAIQRQTLSEVHTFRRAGQSNPSFCINTYLALKGKICVQVRNEADLWQDWEPIEPAKPNSEGYTLVRNQSGLEISLRFDDEKQAQAAPSVQDDIRLIACMPAFESRRLLGSSNGLPGQTFRLPSAPVLDDLIIQVEELEMHDKRVRRGWRDWRRVDDFYASGKTDRHYVLDAATGDICFGDGVHGAIPQPPDEPGLKNIRVIQYRFGGGVRGNVQKDTITQIIDPVVGITHASIAMVATDSQYTIQKYRTTGQGAPALTVTNLRAATGGVDREALQDTMARARRNLELCHPTVTPDDYEKLVQSTPGLQIARARAVPLFRPGQKDYPSQMEPATMTVIVVPDSRKAEPIPSPGFLRTVRQHLDRHRQITTRVHVIGPDYVRVNVQATVLLRRGMSVADIHQKILNVLDEFLNPLRGGPEGGGWPFGRPVYKSEVYQVLEKRVDEIDGVQRLSLSAQNPDKLKQGNIIILPQELVSSGTHQIDIISQAVFR